MAFGGFMTDPNFLVQMLFDLVSDLSGGLITDLYSLFIGLVVCSFIMIGIDIVLTAINSSMQRYSMDRNFERAQDFLDRRDQMAKGTASWDYYNLKYRNALRKSI